MASRSTTKRAAAKRPVPSRRTKARPTKRVPVETAVAGPEEIAPIQFEQPAPAPAPEPPRRIAIIGTSSTALRPLPGGDEAWEIWLVGPGALQAFTNAGRKWDAVIEVHDKSMWPAESLVPYMTALVARKPGQQVVALAPIDGIPDAVLLPRQDIEYKYGRMFLSSGPAWAFAAALEQADGAPEAIAIWGIDMEWGEEYVLQFQGMKHFIHLARLAGIQIVLPQGSALLRDPNPYPDQFETAFGRYAQRQIDELQIHKGNADNRFIEALTVRAKIDGRLYQAELMMRNFVYEHDPKRIGPER